MIAEPIQAVIRKGKSHYVCDQRLERRLGQLDLRKKNWRAGNALLSLREKLDLDEAPRLSGYDRERVSGRSGIPWTGSKSLKIWSMSLWASCLL